MVDSTPPRIPGYEFRQRLGRGGFSDVYLYEQFLPRRQVAVKVLRIDTLDARQRQAFVSEANTMAQLADHPNIVSVLAADVTSDGHPYLVMSYYPGEDLAQRVARRPLTLAEALRTGIQLSCAIESAHRMQVLHRDIKPANALVSRSGAPGLTDFGIAGNINTLHLEEEVGVSIPWCAPEVLEGRSNGSTAADVYSLGATVWHLLVGRSPFRVPDGDNSQAAMIERVLRAPAPVTGLDVPAALDRLLTRCLAKDPAHRPASALEFARDLQLIEVQQGLPRTETVVLDPHSPPVGPGVIPPPPGPGDPTAVKGPAMLRPVPQTALRPSSSSPAPSLAAGLEPAPSGPWTPGRIALVTLVVLVAGGLGTWLAVRGGDGAEDPGRPGRTSQPPPDEFVQPPPNAPDVADPVRRGDDWLFRWRPVDNAASYAYQDLGTNAQPTTLGPGENRFRVPRGEGRRCYVVFAYGTSGAESAPSARRCTPD